MKILSKEEPRSRERRTIVPAGAPINPGDLLVWLAAESLEAATLGAIQLGLSEADRRLDKLEEQGLTCYQKKALRRSSAEDEDP